MPEIIVRYKSAEILKAIQELAKTFDFVIEEHHIKQPVDYTALPITFSKTPDVTALAGIWKGRDIALEQLRKESWG